MGGAGEDTDFSLCKSGLGQGTHFTAWQSLATTLSP